MSTEIVDMSEYVWIPIAGFFVTFYTAWGGGANDCANSFSSAVGSGAITIKNAVVIASIFEFLGVLLMGSHVSNTVRKNVIDIDLFADEPELLMFGMFCSCLSAGIWLMMATYFKWAVSTTHTTIGAILGFGIAAKGFDAVQWGGVIKIVLSWFLSPVISGLLSSIFYTGIRKFILRKENSTERLIKFFPVLVVVAMMIYTLFIVYKGTPVLKLNNISIGTGICIALGVGLFFAILTQLFYVPYLRRKAAESKQKKAEEKAKAYEHVKEGEEKVDPKSAKEVAVVVIDSNESDSSTRSQIVALEKKLKNMKTQEKLDDLEKLHSNAEVFPQETEDICSFLQVFTACSDSFAHGANDVANAIGPYAAIISIYHSGVVTQKSDIPIWILALGGFGIVIGLATWGYKIIERMGKEMTKITPSRGCCIELGSTAAVIIASRAALPVSTTHCQVGSVFTVGLLDGHNNVDVKVLLYTALSWVATLPVAGIFSAFFYYFGTYSPSHSG